MASADCATWMLQHQPLASGFYGQFVRIGFRIETANLDIAKSLDGRI